MRIRSNLEPLPSPGKTGSQSRISIIKNSLKNGKFLSLIITAIRARLAYLLNQIFKLFFIKNVDFSNMLGETKVHFIDVGAADGYPEVWKKIEKNSIITLFEPEEVAYNVLKTQYEKNPAIKISNKALSENGGKKVLYITAWPRSSSLFKPNNSFIDKTFIKNHYAIIETIEFDTIRLSDVCSEAHFIKIDVEGYELPILKGSGELINSIIGIEIEVNFNNLVSDCPSFAEVDNFLQKHGFSLISQLRPESWHYLLPNRNLESKGFLTSGNCLYFRLPHNIVQLIVSGVWEQEYLKIAASIYLCYGYFEFSYVLIQDAVHANILDINHSLYNSVMREIKTKARCDKYLSYNKLIRTINYVRGTSIYDKFDY